MERRLQRSFVFAVTKGDQTGENRCGSSTPSPGKSIWVSALLAYASNSAGVSFASLRAVERWLQSHPENPLNQPAIRRGFTAEPPT